MSNAILTSRVAIPFAAEVESNLPIISNGNTQFNKNFMGGNGTTIDALLPTYGNTVGTGAVVSLSDVKNGTKAITLTQYNKGLSLTQVEQSLALSSYEDQVAAPFGQKMASDIQKIAVETLSLGAGNVTVVATSATAGSYLDISKGIAAINSSRGMGEKFGVMGPDLATLVQNSGLNFFQADLKDSFLNGKLGTFRGARFFETQDVGQVFTSGAATGTLSVGANYVAGATSITIAGGTGTLKKGDAFTVAGVYAVDVFGDATAKLFSFIAQADVTLSSGGTAVTIVPCYATGALKNISALPTSTTTVVRSHGVSKTYLSALMWSKPAFVTASAKLKPLSQVESKSVNGKIMGLTISKGTDITNGIDIVRFDALLGFALIYANMVSRVDVEVV
jgi:hypothetical protein